MKIAKVEAIPVSYPEPNDFNALRHLCLAKITADDGQVGWGESITQFPEANFAAKAIIEGMAPNLIGKDPVQTETLWRQNKQQAWWYGYHGGIASYAIAAIDIALWDLKGKALGASVLDLLGGPVHERLPAIASCHAHYESIPDMAEETAEWISTGLQGLKTGFGKRGDAPVSATSTIATSPMSRRCGRCSARQMLMIDNGIAIKWDVTDAVRRARAMEEYNLAWIEEPLGAWDPEGYANLRAKTTTRIAYGEREWTLEQFERVLATGTVDVDRRRSRTRRGHHRLQEGDRALRVLSPAGQRACLVVGDRDRRQPGDLVQLAGLQAVRAQAAAQSDAARPRRPSRSATSTAGSIRRPARGSESRSSRTSWTAIAARRCSADRRSKRDKQNGRKHHEGVVETTGSRFRSVAARSLIAGASLAQQPSESQIPDDRREGRRRALRGQARLGRRSSSPTRIADKIKKGEPINYVFSYQASGIPLFSPQYKAGFEMGCKMGNAIYPMNCAAIAPVQNDPNQQVSQIEAKLAAGEIDCIGIEPVSSDAMTAITNKLMEQGIPVFTAGVTSRGHEFTNFTQIPAEGGQDRRRDRAQVDEGQRQATSRCSRSPAAIPPSSGRRAA